jgi:hypothetical protein
LESACVLLEQAGISIAKDEGQKAGFEVGQRRGSANRTTVLEATVLLDNNLKQVWKGNRMVNERRLVCEESQGVEEEEEQTERTAKLSPTNPYASDMLQKWVQIWHTLGVDEIDINEVILLSVSCYLPDWQGEEVQAWSPSAPRPLRGVWEGTGAGQGQIRLRGAPIPAQYRNTHQLREAHAVRNQQAFDEREKGGRHHLSEGAGRRQRRDKIQLGIPRCDVLPEKDADRGDTLTTMLGAPGWLKDVQIPVWWEPLVPGSAMERESSVCIRFEQLRAQQRDAEAMATRQQIRSRLVEILNKIQQVSGVDNAPFVATDVSYIAYVNKEGKLEGLITIQKRTKEALEDDIAIGVMLAFHIGNEVQSETAQGFKWCPVSGEYGRTQCGVTGITAAHTWAGLSRRKVTMGTQKAGRRVWIIRDPKEGTIRRIVALLSGRNGDRASLLARIRTTPWSRKKQHMIRKGQPRAAAEAMGAASTLVGQLGAEENGKESGIAPQKPGKISGFLGWIGTECGSKGWVQSRSMSTDRQDLSRKLKQRGFESKVIGTVLRRQVKDGSCWKGAHVKLRGLKHDLVCNKPANRVLYRITCSPCDSEDTWGWQIWG